MKRLGALKWATQYDQVLDQIRILDFGLAVEMGRGFNRSEFLFITYPKICVYLRPIFQPATPTLSDQEMRQKWNADLTDLTDWWILHHF